jgi:hypothetical protein
MGKIRGMLDDEGLQAYRERKNQQSMDGLPAIHIQKNGQKDQKVME